MSGVNKKRKHVALTILEKVEILKKMDDGATPSYITQNFGISIRTVYDIRKNKEKLLNYYRGTDSNKGLINRKTLHCARSVNLDSALYEWFKERRSEGVPITGPLLREKAKQFHRELDIKESCDFSTGWLTRFKKRHGIRYIKTWGEKNSADKDAAEDFVEELSEFILNNNLCPEQIYNLDEMALFWKCLPRKTLVGRDENGSSNLKEIKERVTVFVCANAAGTHKCKLLVIGKSQHPRALKGVKTLPIIYKSNKKAWATKEITTEWFKNYFVKEARQHCQQVGLDEKCKILLLMDNCAAHPDLNSISSNVVTMFLPPNTTSLLQPMDQGIIHSLKCHYKETFLQHLLDTNPAYGLEDARKQFNLKQCFYLLAEAWDFISKETLANAWHQIWPASLFFETDDENDFSGFKPPLAKIKALELMNYAQGVYPNSEEILTEEGIVEWMNIEDDENINHLTDEEIILSVMSPSLSSDTESETEEEKIKYDEGLALGEKYIKFLEQQKVISQQDLMTVHRIQKTLQQQKYTHLKQTTIDELFKKKS